MQIKVFTISIYDNATEQEKLNQFLRSHKVLAVKQKFVKQEGYWSFCVRYLDAVSTKGNYKRNKVDYSSQLSKANFERFTQLRAARKQIAKEEAIPAYAVFTDAELLQIVQLEELTPKNIQGIKGIGEKKIEKYSARILKGIVSPTNNKPS